MPSSLPTVAVVGGGVIGLTVAWTLGRRGHRVTVYDPAPARGASWAAAGMLSPAGEAWFGEESLLRLGLDSLARWPGVARDLEADAGWGPELRTDGTLLVAATDDDARAQTRVQALMAAAGIAHRPLGRREVRALEPALHPGLHSVTEVSTDHSVNNRTLVAALLTACARREVAFDEDTVDVVTEAGVATGVRTHRTGRHRRHAVVVVANGVGLSATCGAPEWLRSAVRPVKGEILRVRTPRPTLARTVRADVRGRSVYLVPRSDGEVVVGATSLERGHDTAVTLEAVHDLLHDAIEVVPELRDATFVEATAGLRPATPDHVPLVGQTGVDALLVAGGHHRGGVLLAPWTAAVVAALVAGDAPPAGADTADPLRFALEEAR
ncbi:glycine oxidase ThiO [Mumia zhuanghuii]|uniref:glycine oxidase n=2 Tax=Mumia TaxID=1546255 RepID=A0ABW1QHN5_9ACTN|nr:MULTISPECIES: glycine oxidase ThiO [Mumia]KAA1422911.1 glycine oxidase ThiO [Mumia zhuanghuii]